MATRTETITAGDGGTFAGHTVVPERGSGPGLLVLQEIFGVNSYIRDVCDRVAALGYVALAPDLFWRIEPGVALDHSPEALEAALTYPPRFDHDAGLADTGAALDHLRALPEVTGGVGVIGFCFGGTMTFRAACHLGPDAAVGYYGSGIGGLLDEGAGIAAPLLLQYGSDDPYIPTEEIEAVQAFAAGNPHVEVRTHPAGHAFDNDHADMFHDATAKAAAWEETTSFLAEHLPVAVG